MALMGIGSTIARKLQEQFNGYIQKRRKITERMADAVCYADYSRAFEDLRNVDKQYGRRKSSDQESKLYTIGLFKAKTDDLKKSFENLRGESDVGEMVRGLREDLVRNLGNMQDSYIYEYFGEVPAPIRDYLEEVKRQILHILQTPLYPTADKLSFLQEARHAFGRTALLLSGGGALGAFHLGVVKALLDNDLLPRILGGSSVGSIVAAIVGSHTDAELHDLFSHLGDMNVSFFSNSTLRQFLAHLLDKGHLQDEAFLIARLKSLLGELTFKEAHEKSGRILNVVVCAADTNEPPRVLNYLTAPGVLIWSAVAASSAFPGLFPAQDIRARNSRGEEVRFSSHALLGAERRWRDGSLEEDLPLQTLRELFNVNNFLVSQTNPHIVPILNFKNKFDRRFAKMIESEWKHRCQQLQWALPDWIPTKWLSLFSQNWEGDVTMVLPTESYWTLRKAVVNPTRREVLVAAHAGEMATWQKLPAIQCSSTIERTLDDCLMQLVATLRKNRKDCPKVWKSRIPSWLHMPTSGMPSADSLVSLLDYEGPEDSASIADSTSDAMHDPIQSNECKNLLATMENSCVDCLDESVIRWTFQNPISLPFDLTGSDDGGLDVIAP